MQKVLVVNVNIKLWQRNKNFKYIKKIITFNFMSCKSGFKYTALQCRQICPSEAKIFKMAILHCS